MIISTSSVIWKSIIRTRGELKETLGRDAAQVIFTMRRGKFDWKVVYDSSGEKGHLKKCNTWICNKINSPRISFSTWMITNGVVYTKDKLL